MNRMICHGKQSEHNLWYCAITCLEGPKKTMRNVSEDSCCPNWGSYQASWTAELIRELLHWDISFSCWFRGIRVCLYFFVKSMPRRLWIRSLYSWRSWWSRWYHKCRYADTCGGLTGLGLLSSTVKVSGFLDYQHPD
jgi:hypothetical protein